MFKKDRKIANQKAMIEHRDELIERQREKIDSLNMANKMLNEENVAVYEENGELRFENDELIDALRDIEKLAEGNTYNNDKIILGKIKELAKTAIQH